MLNSNSNTKANANTKANNNAFEKCKEIIMKKQVPMLYIQNIVIGSVGTVIPWVVLLLIVGFIIVV